MCFSFLVHREELSRRATRDNYEREIDNHYQKELREQRNIQREKERLTFQAKRTVQYELEREKLFPYLFTPPSYDTVIKDTKIG